MFIVQIPKTIVDAAQKHPLAAITASRIATEIVCSGVFIGAAHIVDNQSYLVPAKKALATVLEPILPALDNIMNAFPAAETDRETKTRHAALPYQKAYIYADCIIDNSIRGGLSFAAQMACMGFFDNQLGVEIAGSEKNALNIKNPYFKAAIWDHTVQLGSVLTLNSILSRHNESVQRNLEGIIEKSGVAKEDAACIARDTMCLIVPNIAGALAGIASLYQSHGKTRA